MKRFRLSEDVTLVLIIILVGLVIVSLVGYFLGVLGVILSSLALVSGISYLHAYAIGLGGSFANKQPSEGTSPRVYVLAIILLVIYMGGGFLFLWLTR